MTYKKKRFTPAERRLLDCLREKVGHVVSHRHLIRAMRGFGSLPIIPTNRQMGLLRKTICGLRQEIEEDPALPDIIITHRGQGYSFQIVRQQ